MDRINIDYEKIWRRFKAYIQDLYEIVDDVRPQDVLTVMNEIDDDIMLLDKLYLAVANFPDLDYVKNYKNISQLLNDHDRSELVPLLKQKMKKCKDQNKKRSILFQNLVDIVIILEGGIYEE